MKLLALASLSSKVHFRNLVKQATKSCQVVGSRMKGILEEEKEQTRTAYRKNSPS